MPRHRKKKPRRRRQAIVLGLVEKGQDISQSRLGDTCLFLSITETGPKDKGRKENTAMNHQKISWHWSLVVLSFLLMVLVEASGVPATFAGSSVGSFEIDGNLVDDPPGEPIDWSTDPAGTIPHPALPNRVDFIDASGQGDNSFGLGSKELEPGAWQCITGSAPGKDDIVKGAVALRAIGQKRFMYEADFGKWARNPDSDLTWRPASRMPLEAVRTHLEITAVR